MYQCMSVCVVSEGCFLQDHFGDCVTKAVKFVEKMTEADLKQKVGRSELGAHM